MNRTEILIDRLAARGTVFPGSKQLAFALPLAAAVLAGVLSLVILIDLPFGSVGGGGWGPLLAKWLLLVPLAAGALAALHTLGFPGRRSSLLLVLALVPLALMAGLAMLEMTGRHHPFPGTSWPQCLTAVGLIGGLGMAAAIYSARLMAPVRLRRAGLAAGLFGGAMAGAAYAPFCAGLGATYMLVFYGGPIIALGMIGWLAGPKLLRW